MTQKSTARAAKPAPLIGHLIFDAPQGAATVIVREGSEGLDQGRWVIPAAALKSHADLDRLDLALNHFEGHTRYVTASAPRLINDGYYTVELRKAT